MFMLKRIKIGWEKAILKVFEQKGGVVTLQELYKEIPILIEKTSSIDINHTIRAYLRRLKQNKKLIKQIGLSTYALIDIHYQNSLYENIKSEEYEKVFFGEIPKEEIHGYVEGMLVELGNFSGYNTYTPDKNVIFNGKRISDLIHYLNIPKFSYPDILKKVRHIDVIWFQDGFPIKTFDVEHSTDFSKALLRAYQLRYYNVKFFVVSSEIKKRIFEDRINIMPFINISEITNFITYKEVYEIYRVSAIHNKITSKSFIFE